MDDCLSINEDNLLVPTRGFNIQEWYNSEYITGIDDRVQLHEGRHSGRGGAANATIISIRMENGMKVIVSELCITDETALNSFHFLRAIICVHVYLHAVLIIITLSK